MKMVNGKDISDAGFKYIGVSYEVMDCQKFVEQCLKDCGIDKNLAGSNAWYREIDKKGVLLTPEECVGQLGTVPAGAFLFIHANDGGEPPKYHGDGLGNASHIGLATGKGEGAIHSSKSRDGVCESKFKNKTINGGWNMVGLWNRISYDYGEDTKPEPDPGPEPDPTPEPDPEPQEEFYEVYADNGKTVKMRAQPSTNCSLYWDIPCGEIVIVEKDKGEWCAIRLEADRKKCGYMKSKFLRPLVKPEPEPEPDPKPTPPKTTYYKVTIEHLTEYDVEALKARYDGAVSIKKEE